MEVDGKALLVTIFIIILLAMNILFGMRSSTASARLEEAKEVVDTVMVFIADRGYYYHFPSCQKASSRDYVMVNQCLKEVLAGQIVEGAFEETAFQNYVPDYSDGYLVIKNTLPEDEFTSANFSLYLNNQPIARGCDTPGVIGPGYTCRFTFTKPCNTGDNLLVKYNRERAFLKNC
ncbi:hypothetical protein D6789_03760 [Candidatus Woesearchaeota archaeon]|nr:MAG: hypothetical protein D6789_03760 [Candidatus Woesearchaeota archaeon]